MKYCIVIIDGAAGLGKEALNAITATEDILIVTNPELPAITDALKTIKLAEQFNKNILGIVLTKTGQSQKEVALRSIESMLEKPIVSVIPYDPIVKEAMALKDAVVFTHSRSKPAIAYKKLAAALIGQDYYEDYNDTKNESLLSRLLKKFGFKN